MNLSDGEYFYIKGKIEALSAWSFKEDSNMYSELDSILDVLNEVEKKQRDNRWQESIIVS